MRRLALIVSALVGCALAGLLSAVVVAAPAPLGLATTGTTTLPTVTGTVSVPTVTTAPTTTAPTTTTTPTTTAPRTPSGPATIPEGVTIAGVPVGGLSPTQASLVVEERFRRPLVVRLNRHRFAVAPSSVGTYARIKQAVDRARSAQPYARIPLGVVVRTGKVAGWVNALARRFDRAPVDSTLSLRRLRPWLTKERPGRQIQRMSLRRAIAASFRLHRRAPIRLRTRSLPAAVTRANYGPVVVIRRGSKALYLYQGMRLRRSFGVATGQSAYPTPLGRFGIVVKWRNPWWYPPDSEWAKDEKPKPPGPGNPLGTRWMGISAPGVGIHGTPDSASIGYSASHGCIRMHIPDAEWLFNRIGIGTTVFIVSA